MSRRRECSGLSDPGERYAKGNERSGRNAMFKRSYGLDIFRPELRVIRGSNSYFVVVLNQCKCTSACNTFTGADGTADRKLRRSAHEQVVRSLCNPPGSLQSSCSKRQKSSCSSRSRQDACGARQMLRDSRREYLVHFLSGDFNCLLLRVVTPCKP